MNIRMVKLMVTLNDPIVRRHRQIACALPRCERGHLALMTVPAVVCAYDSL